MSINVDHALQVFNRHGIDPAGDFHALRSAQVEVLVSLANQQGYRKPIDANGSTARYYFYAVQRRHLKR